MSHRNGKPKPHASNRTWKRWNERKDNNGTKVIDTTEEQINTGFKKTSL